MDEGETDRPGKARSTGNQESIDMDEPMDKKALVFAVVGTLIIFAAIFWITREPQLHPSKIMTEEGVVVAKQYQGEVNETATGVGFSTSGDLVVSSHTIHESAKFNVVFRCEHGVLFTINRAEVYGKVKEQDRVEIKYHELRNKEGEVKDFDFIDANPIEQDRQYPTFKTSRIEPRSDHTRDTMQQLRRTNDQCRGHVCRSNPGGTCTRSHGGNGHPDTDMRLLRKLQKSVRRILGQ